MKLKCLLAMLLLTILSCSNSPAVEDKVDSLPHSEPGKTLIVYFSWSGHTQAVANIIHELIGCDMVEIEPEEPYSDEYNEVVDRFKNERDNQILPALRTKVENMDDYDTLIIGSPIWGGLLASPVKSFLSGYDLSGKKILPFCTHGGSGTAQSVDNIRKLCPHAEILQPLAVYGSQTANSRNEVKKWLSEAGFSVE